VSELRERTPIRAADIKELNERLVLGMVFRATMASQSEVVALSSLKAPTVFRIFGELERAGLIVPVVGPALASDRKGRRPTWYSTVPDAYRVVGLDFRAGGASVVVEDFSARILYSEERPLPNGSNADEAYGIVSELIADALNRSSGGPLLGIGVGAPGVVDLERGVVLEYMRIPGLSGFPVAEKLSERFGTDVRMSNNATVAAVAAYRYGDSSRGGGTEEKALPRVRSALDTESVFALLVRAGVGGAFVKGGSPYENGGKTAIEVGHMTMDPNGPACPCGGTGCLEAYISEDALVAAVAAERPCADFKDLDRLLTDGDRIAARALLPAIRRASVALLNVMHLLDPGEFVVISRSSALSDLIAGEAERYLSSRPRPRPDGGAQRVRGCRWDPIFAGRAACDMVFDGFFA